MDPARKHFKTDDFAGRKVNLRLEIGHELAMLEAEANALLDLAVRNECALHSGIKRDRTCNPAAARMIHRDVGPAQNVRNAHFRGWSRRNARKCSDLDDPFLEKERTSDRMKHDFGKLVGAAHFISAQRQCNCKFVTAETRKNRIWPELGGKRNRKCL